MGIDNVLDGSYGIGDEDIPCPSYEELNPQYAELAKHIGWDKVRYWDAWVSFTDDRKDAIQ